MMDKKEILFFIEATANEKNLDKSDVVSALESALASATRKALAKELEVQVKLDKTTGDYQAFRVWRVVDPDNMPEIEQDEQLVPVPFNANLMISVADAQQMDASLGLDDFVTEPLAKVNFGRIGAQTAKQVMAQKLREISRRKVAEQFEEQIGQILHTTVKRLDRGRVILDLGDNVEGTMLSAQQMANDNYSVSKRVRAYLYEVSLDYRSPQILLSRSMPAMVEELMRMEGTRDRRWYYRNPRCFARAGESELR